MAAAPLLRRFALVAAVALLVAGGALLSAQRAASAPPPGLTAAELLASVVEALAADPSLSGEALVRADLGLPEGAGELGAAIGWLSGDTRLRLWRSPDGVRVAELTATAERVFASDRTEAWTWDSDRMRAGRLPVGDGHPVGPARPADPLALAERALEAVGPSTDVAVDGGVRVAGRDAWVLALVPRDDDTLVGRVELALDAEQRLPLRAAVYPRGSGVAALEAAFTSVSFAPVDPALFVFHPPPGAEVEDLRDRRRDTAREPTDPAAPRAFGQHWTKIVAIPVGDRADDTDRLKALLPFSGTLLSARLAHGGEWLLVGAVTQEALAAVESQLP